VGDFRAPGVSGGRCRRRGLEVTIDDDGPGLPTDFEEKEIKKRFGLRTAMSLDSRAKGELTWTTSPSGTTFRLSLPEELVA
jgi:signal transduction histidine kinase